MHEVGKVVGSARLTSKAIVNLTTKASVMVAESELEGFGYARFDLAVAKAGCAYSRIWLSRDGVVLGVLEEWTPCESIEELRSAQQQTEDFEPSDYDKSTNWGGF